MRRRSLPRSIAELRLRASEAVRDRTLAAATARDTTPPPPSAFAAFGAGSWIVPPARVTLPSSISIGEGTVIMEHSFISVVAAIVGVTPKLTIGDHCQIGTQIHIACVGEIEIGHRVLTAARVFIGDTFHRYDDPSAAVLDQPMADPAKVTIADGAFLGIGSAVLMGVTVGEGAYVAAGAVVTEDVEPRTLVVGNPARPLRRWHPDREAWEPVNPAGG